MEPSELSAYAREKFQVEEQRGYTIVLEETAVNSREACSDTPLPFADMAAKGLPRRESAGAGEAPWDIPEKIRRMLNLYEYGGSSLAHKAKNFYHQGKLMQDYEDDVPWKGEYQRYFTTYHDLNLRQLRGYFTWRTHIRRGDFFPIATSLAYIYLYELLNGIGADSPCDALCKMREFEKGYIDSGVGDPGMRKNLHKWMLEYAVVHALPAETVMRYLAPELLEKDAALAVLKTPKQHTEEEIFSALCTFAGKTLTRSPVVTKDERRAERLFAGIWKYLSEHYQENGKDIFTACFGRRRAYRWYPLSNAVYYEKQAVPDTDIVLNECRSYHCRGGIWKEERYDSLNFDSALFQSIVRAADRMLRKRYKTGHYLREKPGEAWLAPYIAAVMEADLPAQEKSGRPEITIDFSSLAQIRQEAFVTRDSLLTEEETDEIETSFKDKMEERERKVFEGHEAEKREQKAFGGYEAEEREQKAFEGHEAEERGQKAFEGHEQVFDGYEAEERERKAFDGLDPLHLWILDALLHGQFTEDMIKSRHLMPSIVTDTINNALFDEIGDNILECDGGRIAFVEDYREEVIEAIGGGRDE